MSEPPRGQAPRLLTLHQEEEGSIGPFVRSITARDFASDRPDFLNEDVSDGEATIEISSGEKHTLTVLTPENVTIPEEIRSVCYPSTIDILVGPCKAEDQLPTILTDYPTEKIGRVTYRATAPQRDIQTIYVLCKTHNIDVEIDLSEPVPI